MRKVVIIFVLFTFFLTGCEQNTTIKDPSNIKYDGNYITWDEVKGAQSYEVIINDNAPLFSEINRFSYDSLNQSFQVSIQAINSSSKGEDSNKVVEHFNFIGTVDNIHYEDGKIVWDTNPNATSYQVKINNGTPITANINELGGLPTGKNSVQVIAVDVNNANNYSKWSLIYQYTLLESPTNIQYDSSIISWDSVSNATGYIVSINSFDYNVGNTLEYAFVAEGISSLAISVKALGNESTDVYDSAYALEKTYVYLEPIHTVDVNDGIVTWDFVDHATHYKVEVKSPTGTTTHEVTTNSYTGLEANTQYQIRVFALSKAADNYFSSWSSLLNVRILPAPVIQYQQGVFLWNTVSGATGYVADLYKGTQKINTEVTPNDGSYGVIYDFEAVGTYTLKVKSVVSASDSGVFDSQFSATYTIVRLDSPTGIMLEHDVESFNSARIRFNTVSYSSGYQLYIDDIAIGNKTTATLMNIDETAEQTLVEKSWQVSVAAIGGHNQTTRTVVLDSKPSIPLILTKLGAPTQTAITNGVFGWLNVSKNNGYSIDLKGQRYLNGKDDTDYGIAHVTSGDYKIKVRALGNGSNTISSDFSSEVSFNKLRQPEITVTNGLISWMSIADSTGYQYSVNSFSGSFNNTVLQYQITNSDLINSTAVFNIYAKGNGSNILNSDASSTSTLTKLNAPQIRITNDNVSWEAVTSAQNYDFYIGEMVFKSAITGNSFQTNELPANEYTFVVVANGNPSTTISSDKSNVITVTKLQSPNVRIENNIYVWDNVPGAEKYTISILGSSYVVTTNTFDPYTYFTKAQTYKVDFQAINEGTQYIDSNLFSINQQVSNLQIPTLSSTVIDRAVSVSIVDNSNKALGYALYMNGNKIALQNSTYQFEATIGTYDLKAIVIGGLFFEGIYYKDSLATESRMLTFLPTPTNVKLEQPNLTQKVYNLTWDAITGATNYDYVVSSGETIIASGTVTSTQVLGIDLSLYTSISITIKAIGNQTTTFNSSIYSTTKTLIN
jgi:hypothetical protein